MKILKDFEYIEVPDEPVIEIEVKSSTEEVLDELITTLVDKGVLY